MTRPRTGARQGRYRTRPVGLLLLIPLWASCGSTSSAQTDTSPRVLERVAMNEPPSQRRLIRVGAVSPMVVSPYEPIELLSDFWDCRGRRRHAGLDLAGVGADGGLGTPVVAMARSRVVEVGTPELDPSRFGRRFRNASSTVRGGVELPTSKVFPEYGEVWFFTENYGSARTGVLVVTEVLDGPMAGHQVRYMHLAAVHPLIVVGAELSPGQEIGLMGGTAVLESPPHVHIDAADSAGRRVDLAPLLGIPSRAESDVPGCR